MVILKKFNKLKEKIDSEIFVIFEHFGHINWYINMLMVVIMST